MVRPTYKMKSKSTFAAVETDDGYEIDNAT